MLRIFVSRTHGISTILLTAFKSLLPAKHYFGSRHRAHLRLRGFWCHGRWSPAVRRHPGIFWPRILAAALSLAATGACMVLFEVSHPPAGATTLIVSLGIIWRPRELVIIEVAVLLLVAQAMVINRLAGFRTPCGMAQRTARHKGSRCADRRTRMKVPAPLLYCGRVDATADHSDQSIRTGPVSRRPGAGGGRDDFDRRRVYRLIEAA